MNCYEHPDVGAVASCVDCGNGLCKPCAETYSIKICTSCNNKRGEKEKKTAIRNIIISAVLFISAFCIGLFGLKLAGGIVGSLIFGWVMGGWVWGISAMIKSAKEKGTKIEGIGWAIAGAIGLFIGIVALPLGLVRGILTLVRLKRDK